MDQDNKFNRRELFRRGAALGAAVAGSSVLLAACGNKEEAAGGAAAALSCSDVSALSDADKATRTSLEYVDATPDAAKPCDACQLYQPGAANACGTCTVVKGPIHPKGYCKSWVAKQG